MDEAIIFHDMVMANSIFERWPGIEDFELAKLIDDAVTRGDVPFDYTNDFPDPYFLRKTRTDPVSGKKYYFCERITKAGFYHVQYSGNETVYDFESIAFSVDHVKEWEKSRPWLKFVESISNNDEWMYAEDVRKKFKKRQWNLSIFLREGC